MSETKINLQTLVGNLCEIKTEQNDLLMVARVASVDPEDDTRITIVSAQEDERLPLMAYHTPVKIVSFANKQSFLLLRGYVYISTSSLLTLVDVKTAQDHERRRYFRLNANITAHAVLQRELLAGEDTEEETLVLTLHDISLGGARIGSSRALKPGEHLLISFELLDKKMEFCCRVCREIPTRRTTSNQRQYGCEFINFSTRQIDQLCNILFKMQRIEIRNRKKTRYS